MSVAATLGAAAGASTDAASLVVRATKIVAGLDAQAPAHVLWVPGTSTHGVPHAFARAAEAQLGVRPVAINYPASWDFEASVADGIATANAVLDAIRGAKLPGKVYLGGESQGAWVLGEALAGGRHDDVFERAVLLGHPQVADHHFPIGDSRIIEINHPRDAVTVPLRGDNERLRRALADFAAGRARGRAGAALAGGALRNPRYLALTVLGEAYRIPRIGARFANHHDYTNAMPAAAHFLATGDAPVVRRARGAVGR